jgi:hypothetical protein
VSRTTSTERSTATRERASHALQAAVALSVAHSLPADVRADVAHLLRADWGGVAYTRTREVLAGLILDDRDAPTCDPGSYRIGVARRLQGLAQTLHTDQLAQLESVVYLLRHAWIGAVAESPDRVLLRETARLIQDRRRAVGGAS